MAVRNILFIMCDQLRWDYLSCYGHPVLRTPNIDRLGSMGVRFEHAFVQSPICGPSRMCFYTGRTVFSHGATWNFVPLPVGEYTLGDYLRPHGVRVAVAGKTHMYPDKEGFERLRLDPTTDVGRYLAEGGFEPFDRDDGIHPPKGTVAETAYMRWLRSLGYVSENPWNDFVNAAEGPNGEVLSGWSLRNARFPARVSEQHSETAYITDRALQFIDASADTPWLLHLSYIKPHWPYIAPAPYHALYQGAAIPPAVRSEAERFDPHPVYGAFMAMDAAKAFSRDEVRGTVVPAYMGLVKQIDDHIGRLLTALERRGRLADTMIVFTSDHGDYLGDHWLGEKELFHEQSVRVPLLIYDPDPRADVTRSRTEHRLTEAIDLVPTFLEAMGLALPTHRLEGRSLLPLLRSETAPTPAWRTAVFSELDYAFYRARLALDVGPSDARCFMLRTHGWKYIHYKNFRPQLFDLASDPDEFRDLGDSPTHASVREQLNRQLFDRVTARRNRVALTDEEVVQRTDRVGAAGIVIGEW